MPRGRNGSIASLGPREGLRQQLAEVSCGKDALMRLQRAPSDSYLWAGWSIMVGPWSLAVFDDVKRGQTRDTYMFNILYLSIIDYVKIHI